MSDIKILQERFPFLTIFRYADEEFLGIIQTQSKTVVSAYIFNDIINKEEQKEFIELGDVWWSESNRKVPINLFLKQDFEKFERYLKHFTGKEFKIVIGPTVSLQNLSKRRVKRKRIELIREDK